MEMTTSAGTPSARALGRRRRWGVAAVVVALALVGAACGSSSKSSSGPSGTTAATDVDPAGILKIASGLSPLGPLHFDPATSVVNGDLTWEELIFGTLLRWNPSGGLDAWMAKSYKVVDPQTVELTLRDGMTFTDGTPYDATAVKAGLLHIMNDATGEAKASRHAGFKFLQDITIDSPTQLTFKLNAPGASDFLESLAHREGSIVDPKQIGTPDIDTKPIGAGPFMFSAYTPDQILSVRRNTKFFDSAHFRLGGIDFLNLPDATSAVNGLLAGSVDMAPVQNSDVPKVQADTRYNLVSGSTDYSYVILQECPSKPPFNNVAVQKAVQLAFDRDAIIKLVFQGNAKAAYGLWPEGNVNFNPATKDINKYDPTAAKKILADAGLTGTNITFEMHYVSAITIDGPLTEVLQSQLAAIGIKATIVPDKDILSSFIVPKKPGAQVIPGSRRNVDKYGRLFVTGGTAVLCDSPRQDIMDVVTPTAGMALNDPARAAAFQKAELMAAQNANPVPLVFTIAYTALAKDRVGGTPAFSQATGAVLLDNVYIKKK